MFRRMNVVLNVVIAKHGERLRRRLTWPNAAPASQLGLVACLRGYTDPTLPARVTLASDSRVWLEEEVHVSGAPWRIL